MEIEENIKNCHSKKISFGTISFWQGKVKNIINFFEKVKKPAKNTHTNGWPLLGKLDIFLFTKNHIF